MCGICSSLELDTKPGRKSGTWTTCVSAHCCWVWPDLLGTGSSEKPVSIYKLLEQLHSLIISKLQVSKKGQMNSSDNILTDNVLTFLKHSKGAFQIGFGRWKKWTECGVCSQKHRVMAASAILLQYWTFFDLQKLKQSVSEEIAPGCCDRKEMYCVNAGPSHGTEDAVPKENWLHVVILRPQRTGSETQKADKVEITARHTSAPCIHCKVTWCDYICSVSCDVAKYNHKQALHCASIFIFIFNPPALNSRNNTFQELSRLIPKAE